MTYDPIDQDDKKFLEDIDCLYFDFFNKVEHIMTNNDNIITLKQFEDLYRDYSNKLTIFLQNDMIKRIKKYNLL
jgi:hypothetical protein